MAKCAYDPSVNCNDQEYCGDCWVYLQRIGWYGVKSPLKEGH